MSCLMLLIPLSILHDDFAAADPFVLLYYFLARLLGFWPAERVRES